LKKLFETEKLVIREWTEADAQDLFEMCSDPRVTEFIAFPTYQSIKDAEDRIEVVLGRYKMNLQTAGDFVALGSNKIDFAIVLCEAKKAVGQIGYSKKSDDAGGVVELGYILNPKFWGKGIMTEAVRGMIRYIFENKIAMRIEAKFNTLNTASGEVMKRVGMTFEGVMRKAFDDGKMKRADMALYSILVEECC
jgi:ribosomal-protein-alanine N-acetyltransferase